MNYRSKPTNPHCFVEMDEGGPSNWNRSNIRDPNEVNNQSQQTQNTTMNRAAQRRRRNRDITVAAVAAAAAYLTITPALRMHNSILPGWLKIEEYLQGHPRRMFNRVRMTPQVFTALCMLLKERRLLSDTRGLAVEEQLFMFLTIISQSENSRAAQDDFQHSGETVSRHFTTVLEALCHLQGEFITAPNFEEVPQLIRQNGNKYLPWFKVQIVTLLDDQMFYCTSYINFKNMMFTCMNRMLWER